MIEIDTNKLGKRFNREWVFRNWTASFKPTSSYVLLGGNGSGKSTALRLLLGYSVLSEGGLTYRYQGKTIPRSEAYRHFSFCSPYLELYEELTLDEMVRFHFSLKPPLAGIDPKHFAEYVHLGSSKNKPVKFFSSGMKQRLRIGLAMFSNTSGVFLDEPLSNLDRFGIDWYKEVLETYRSGRLIIVASNKQEEEYFFCDQKFEIEDYKPA